MKIYRGSGENISEVLYLFYFYLEVFQRLPEPSSSSRPSHISAKKKYRFVEDIFVGMTRSDRHTYLEQVHTSQQF